MKIYTEVVFNMLTGDVISENAYEYSGPIAECKGPSGKIGYPAYIETFHTGMLSGAVSYNTVDTTLIALHTTSPYTGTVAFDPATLLAATQTRYNTYNALIAAFNPATLLAASQTRYNTYNALIAAFNASANWSTHLSTAQTKIDNATLFPKVNMHTQLATTAISDVASAASTVAAGSQVSSVVTAHEAYVNTRLARSYNRLSGLMAENGALHSAWIMALAMLEIDAGIDADKYDGELRHSAFMSAYDKGLAATYDAANKRQLFRDGFVSDAAGQLTQADQNDNNFVIDAQQKAASLQAEINRIAISANKDQNDFVVEAHRNATSLQAEINRVATVANKEQNDFDIELDVADALWDMQALERAAAILGAPGGAQPVPTATPKGQSAIGGALSGAGLGSMVGGPVGAGIGALLGGLSGYFM